MVKVLLEDLPAKAITEKTVKRMHELAFKAKSDWEFIKFATWLIQGCAPRDHICEIKSIYNRLGIGLKYVKDPRQIELVQSPWAILERRAGDCDCLSTIMAASAGALGYSYRFITVKADPARPTQWSHVYPQILIPRMGWVPADLSLQKLTLGWEPKNFPKKAWKEPKY